jgi:plasmid stabilization system protein ParE
MNKFVLHPEAFKDVDEIWEYIAAETVDAADRVLEEIHDAIGSLVGAGLHFPHQGHTHPDLTSRALRFQVVRDYVIAYAPDENAAGNNCGSAWSAQSSCARCNNRRTTLRTRLLSVDGHYGVVLFIGFRLVTKGHCPR